MNKSVMQFSYKQIKKEIKNYLRNNSRAIYGTFTYNDLMEKIEVIFYEKTLEFKKDKTARTFEKEEIVYFYSALNDLFREGFLDIIAIEFDINGNSVMINNNTRVRLSFKSRNKLEKKIKIAKFMKSIWNRLINIFRNPIVFIRERFIYMLLLVITNVITSYLTNLIISK
jgi:hypothetical protein